MKDKIRVILFAGLLLVLSVFNLLSPAKTFSNRENRFLEKFPELSLDSIIDGKFNEKFQKYAADQFLLRDRWISLKTRVDLGIMKKDNGRVYFGEDNFLFDIEKAIDKDRFIKNMNEINNFKKSVYAPIDIMLVPTKSSVLQDKLPVKAPVIDEEKLLKDIEGELDKRINFISLINFFQSKNDEPVYYKTDHHYTSLGAYYAYEKYIESLGLKAYPLDYFKREAVSEDFLGSQFRKSNYYEGPSETIEKFTPKDKIDLKIIKNENEDKIFNSLYDEKFLEKSDKYSFFLGGDDAVVDIKSSVKGAGTLVVVKDSFANSMVPFLTLHFDRIILIDQRYLNIPIKDYIKDIEVDRVLFLKNIRTFYDG